MKVSIFTATHDSKFLVELYDSIKDQPFYEWVVVYNHNAKVLEFNDERVKSIVLDYAPEYVGYLKSYACDKCTGDILLELDHDDLLLPDAIEEVVKAYENDEEVGFVYSNAVRSTLDFKKLDRFSDKFGWEYRTFNYKGNELDEVISFEADPNSVSRIWFAPDHLRSFRKDKYIEVGGYNKEMRILDDLDLMCRLYKITKFKHIDKPLYLYRVHGENSWIKYNKEIQDNVYNIYDKHIEELILTWCDREKLQKIELGAGINGDERYTGLDLKGADVDCNLDEKWPLEDNSVGVIKAYDTIEHLKDPIHTMKEMYRVLAPGGYALLCVPSTDGRGAFQDPTHVSFWNENSFLYYTDSNWAKYIDSPVRFQAMRMYTTEKNAQGVCWVVAHLVKLVDGKKYCGLKSI